MTTSSSSLTTSTFPPTPSPYQPPSPATSASLSLASPLRWALSPSQPWPHSGASASSTTTPLLPLRPHSSDQSNPTVFL
ncbi:hypothetical protein LINGRAHAP2_LOCUS4464 [Linum grandiflorum]